MSTTIAAAERLAIEGKRPPNIKELDSQDCRDLQQFFFSKSSSHEPDPDQKAAVVNASPNASKKDQDHDKPKTPLLRINNSVPPTPSRLRQEWEHVEAGEEEEEIELVFSDEEEEGDKKDEIVPAPAMEPEMFSSSPGNGVEDYTQRSPMSPTQENPESLYDRFRLLPNTHTPTYHEGDTGHVNLFPYGETEYDHTTKSNSYNENDDISPEHSSQTTTMPAPRTPAVRNPFLQQGTLMKGHEMFGATQPSSVQHMPSGASTRPSISGFPPSSPLHSSVRQILRSSVEETPVPFEPRPYISLKESQERHRSKDPNPSRTAIESDSESESIAELNMRTRRKLRDERIAKETSEVIQTRLGPGPIRSSSNVVEIPSTESKGRRRSHEEIYLAQCSGEDARDTQEQEQECIVDSQNDSNQLPMFSTAQSHLNSDLIPETSPTKPNSGRIRPMGEITLYSEETQDLDAPGFTQDPEFEAVMATSQSEPSPIRPHKSRPLFEGASWSGVNGSFKEGSAVTSSREILDNTQPHNSVEEADNISANSTARQPRQTARKSRKRTVAKPRIGHATAPDARVEKSAALGQIDNAHRAVTVETLAPKFDGALDHDIMLEHGSREEDNTNNENETTIRPETIQQNRETVAQPQRDEEISVVAQGIVVEEAASIASTPLSSVPSSLDDMSSSAVSEITKSRRAVKRPTEDLLPTRASKRLSLRDPRASVTESRSSSVDPLAGPVQVGIFSNMAFAVTYTPKGEKDKASVISQIVSRGGRVLEDFSELFESSGSNELRLSGLGRSIGFVATISDEPSRRIKYLEALALGLPCLSGQWISRCFEQGKLVKWAPYLLSSGKSERTGTFQSRFLERYDAADAAFSKIFPVRSKILSKYSVLRVAPRTETEVTRPHLFLLRILGPSRMVKVDNFKDARKMLMAGDGPTWDLVYVDEKKLAQAKKEIFQPKEAPPNVQMISTADIRESLIVGELL